MLAVGRRLAHGGPSFTGPRVDQETLAQLRELIPLAPFINRTTWLRLRRSSSDWCSASCLLRYELSLWAFGSCSTRAASLRTALCGDCNGCGFHGLSYEYIARFQFQDMVASRKRRESLRASNGKSVDGALGFTALNDTVWEPRQARLIPEIFGPNLFQLCPRDAALQEIRFDRNFCVSDDAPVSSERTRGSFGGRLLRLPRR